MLLKLLIELPRAQTGKSNWVVKAQFWSRPISFNTEEIGLVREFAKGRLREKKKQGEGRVYANVCLSTAPVPENIGAKRQQNLGVQSTCDPLEKHFVWHREEWLLCRKGYANVFNFPKERGSDLAAMHGQLAKSEY